MTTPRKKRGQQAGGAGEHLPAPLPSAQAPEVVTRREGGAFRGGIHPPEPSTILQYEEMHLYSGPLPPPHILAQYKEVQADYPERMMRLAERQVDMAEHQATHRQGLERTVVNGGSVRSWVGLVFGGIIILAAIFCGTYLIINGRSGEGLAAIIIALIGLVGTYIYGVQKQQKQLDRRAQSVPEQSQE